MKHLLMVMALSALLSTAAQSANQPVKPKAKAAPTVVNVTLSEWSIKTVPTKAKTGDIRFYCVNKGEATHALAIVGVKEQMKNIDPGAKGSLTVNLKPGTYTLYCPVDKHRMKGMETNFTVTK